MDKHSHPAKASAEYGPQEKPAADATGEPATGGPAVNPAGEPAAGKPAAGPTNTHGIVSENAETIDGHTPMLDAVEQVSDGWIKKYVLTYTMPNGSSYRYESVSRKGLQAYRRELERNAAGKAPSPDAVCVVPQLPDGKLLLIREFRYPLNSWCVAFPAGLVDEGEDLATCVERELREETGYRLRGDGSPKAKRAAIDALPQSGYSSTGLAEENVQVVFAQVEPDGTAQPEPSEFIETFVLDRADVRRFLDENATPIGTRCQLILELFARTAS